MEALARGLQFLGLQPGQSVALFSESSPRWIVADQAIMMNAAMDAVRGASAPLIELQQIVLNSDSIGLIVQDEGILKTLLQEELVSPNGHEQELKEQQLQFSTVIKSQMKFAVVLWGDISLDTSRAPFPVYTYDQLLSLGKNLLRTASASLPHARSDSIATIVYTSGTSGVPKGVALTHSNILYQIECFKDILRLNPADQVLSLLPPWHIYERATAYYIFHCGCRVVYSGVKTLKSDLSNYPTKVFITVPLVLDTLYKTVVDHASIESSFVNQKSSWTDAPEGFDDIRGCSESCEWIGHPICSESVPLSRLSEGTCTVMDLVAFAILGSLCCPSVWSDWPSGFTSDGVVATRPIKAALGIKGMIICGGGSLMNHLDLFFESIDMTVLNGWGLTETSPVLCCRLQDAQWNVRGTVGFPMPGTEIRIVDPESTEDVRDGTPGLILARGPGVMQEYYRSPEETENVMLKDGWFSTGDCGWRAPSGVSGSQMAGNIVLTGRLKDTIVLSSGKNVEPQPIEDWLQMSPLISHIMLIGQDHRTLGALVAPDEDCFEEAEKNEIHDAILNEIRVLERKNPNFVSHMHISAIQVLDRPLSVEDGTLTRTMKIRRAAVVQQFAQDVDILLKKIR